MAVDTEPNDSARHFDIDYFPLNTCREADSLYPNVICATYKSFLRGLKSQDPFTKTGYAVFLHQVTLKSSHLTKFWPRVGDRTNNRIVSGRSALSSVLQPPLLPIQSLYSIIRFLSSSFL